MKFKTRLSSALKVFLLKLHKCLLFAKVSTFRLIQNDIFEKICLFTNIKNVIFLSSSVTNPIGIRTESNVDVSYSDIPDKYSRYTVLAIRKYNVDYQNQLIHNGKKLHELAFQLDEKGPLRAYGYHEEKSVEIKVDSIWNPRSAEIEIKNNQKYYKINSQRVPKQSVTIKVDSTLNSTIKEVYNSRVLVLFNLFSCYL